jgi:hypothetical protein
MFIFFFYLKRNENQTFLWSSKVHLSLLCLMETLTLGEELGKQNVTGYESAFKNFKWVTLSK